MKLEVSLKDFLDSFITYSDFEISIYKKVGKEDEKELVNCKYVSEILKDHKNLLNRKVDSIDLVRLNDTCWLAITLK